MTMSQSSTPSLKKIAQNQVRLTVMFGVMNVKENASQEQVGLPVTCEVSERLSSLNNPMCVCK